MTRKKFIPDDSKTAIGMRRRRPVVGFLGAEITRKLGPMVRPTGLRCIPREGADFNGLCQIVGVQKTTSRQRSRRFYSFLKLNGWQTAARHARLPSWK